MRLSVQAIATLREIDPSGDALERALKIEAPPDKWEIFIPLIPRRIMEVERESDRVEEIQKIRLCYLPDGTWGAALY